MSEKKILGDGVVRPAVMNRSDILRDHSVVKGRAKHSISELEKLNGAIKVLSNTCTSLTKENHGLSNRLHDIEKRIKEIAGAVFAPEDVNTTSEPTK